MEYINRKLQGMRKYLTTGALVITLSLSALVSGCAQLYYKPRIENAVENAIENAAETSKEVCSGLENMEFNFFSIETPEDFNARKEQQEFLAGLEKEDK